MFLFYIILIVCFSAAITKCLIPFIVRFSRRRNWIDNPNIRSSHCIPTPRLGGVCILVAVFVTLLLLQILQSSDIWNIEITLFELNLQMYFAAFGVILLFVAGLYDDIWHLNAIQKILVQTIVVLCMWFAQIRMPLPESFNHPIFFEPLISILCTWLIFVIIINAINLIDGIDGLAGGISLTALLAFFYLFHSLNQIDILCWLAAAIGSISVFMIYNLYGKRNKLFMGDTGSQLIGLFFASLSIYYLQIQSLNKLSCTYTDYLLLPVLLFLPLVDLIRVFFSRLYRGVSPFSPDQSHIHHLFLMYGFTHKQTAFMLILFSAFFSITHLYLHSYGNQLSIVLIEMILFIITGSLIQIRLATHTN